jgi:hypothetical protein
MAETVFAFCFGAALVLNGVFVLIFMHKKFGGLRPRKEE